MGGVPCPSVLGEEYGGGKAGGGVEALKPRGRELWSRAMEWTWDSDKAEANRRKHGIRFEAAAFALADPRALTLPDPHPDDDRWRTLGRVRRLLLFVVHTLPDTPPGRIISAREATPREQRDYESQ